MNPGTETALFARLQGRMPGFDGVAWALLQNEGRVDEYAEADAEVRERVLDEMVARIRGARARSPGVGAELPTVPEPPSTVAPAAHSGVSREDVLSLLLAREAATFPGAVEFRGVVLGGGLLSTEVLQEALWRVDSTRLFADRIDPPAWGALPSPYDSLMRMIADVLDREPSRDDAESLQNVAGGLADRFGWSEWEAAWFVLTGRAPWRPEVKVSFMQREAPSASRIVLEVDPSVRPDEVADQYRWFRALVTPGQRHREPSRKTLRLLAFLASRPGGEPLTDQLRAWRADVAENLTGDEAAALDYASPSSFARAVRSAERQLMDPGWRNPAREALAQLGPLSELDINRVRAALKSASAKVGIDAAQRSKLMQAVNRAAREEK